MVTNKTTEAKFEHRRGGCHAGHGIVRDKQDGIEYNRLVTALSETNKDGIEFNLLVTALSETNKMA